MARIPKREQISENVENKFVETTLLMMTGELEKMNNYYGRILKLEYCIENTNKYMEEEKVRRPEEVKRLIRIEHTINNLEIVCNKFNEKKYVEHADPSYYLEHKKNNDKENINESKTKIGFWELLFRLAISAFVLFETISKFVQ